MEAHLGVVDFKPYPGIGPWAVVAIGAENGCENDNPEEGQRWKSKMARVQSPQRNSVF